MNTKIFIAILVVLGLAAAYFYTSSTPPAAREFTKEDAIQVAIGKYPELSAYQHTDLPPSSVEAQQAGDGWYVGFIQRGSGLPGILNAKCYHVTTDSRIDMTGQFQKSAEAVVDALDFVTCTPKNS